MVSKDYQPPRKKIFESKNETNNYLTLSRQHALRLLKERREEFEVYTKKEFDRIDSYFHGGDE